MLPILISTIIYILLLIIIFTLIIFSLLSENILFSIFSLVLLVFYFFLLYRNYKNSNILDVYFGGILILCFIIYNIFYFFSQIQINQNYFDNLNNNSEKVFLDINIQCSTQQCFDNRFTQLQNKIDSYVSFDDLDIINQYLLKIEQESAEFSHNRIIHFDKIDFIKKSLYNTLEKNLSSIDNHIIFSQNYENYLHNYNSDIIDFMNSWNDIWIFNEKLKQKYPRSFFHIYINKKYFYQFTYYPVEVMYSYILIINEIDMRINSINKK